MTELRLPLDHAEAALKQAILDHLKMREDALLESQPGHRIQVCCKSAGLLLAQMGFKPIILEREKVVRERTKDTFGLWRKRKLNPESNLQFGEETNGVGSSSNFQPAFAPKAP